LVTVCRTAHYDDRKIKEGMWEIFRLGNWYVAEVYVARGWRCVAMAEELTRQNRANDLFNGDNSCGAWLRISTRYAKGLAARKKEENDRDGTNAIWWDWLPDMKALWMTNG
jgi:hypothetical protein